MDILATAVVPWTEKGDFDEERFARQVNTIATGLTPQIYVFGTAGEGYAVSERQFDRIAAVFWTAAAAAGATPMLGVISLSLATIVERIERGRALGFRRFQLSLPSWGALNDAELDRFFEGTCGRFPDCEFHHYNLMRTKRLLTGADYRRLAAAHANLRGVKASTADPAVLADLLTAAPRIRFYFTEQGYTIARRTHDVGLLISLASVHYDRAREFVAGPPERRAADAVELAAMGEALREISAGRFHLDGAFDKLLFRFSDPDFPLRLLPPYSFATEADFARFAAALPPGWRRG